jgi:hypothetical protein
MNKKLVLWKDKQDLQTFSQTNQKKEGESPKLIELEMRRGTSQQIPIKSRESLGNLLEKPVF